MKRRLTEIYGLKEGPFDDINRQLGGAQSAARDPRTPQQKARVGSSGAAQRAQADLDQATSVAKREALGDEKTHPVDLTVDEMHAIANWADMYGDDEDPKLLRKIEDALRRAEGSDGDSSSMSMTRVTSRKTPFGGGM